MIMGCSAEYWIVISMSSRSRRCRNFSKFLITVLTVKFFFHWLFSAEGEQALRQSGCAFRRLHNLINIVSYRIVVPQFHLGKVTVAYDRGQDVVEIVRYAASESTDGLHFLSLLQVLLKFFLFRNVAVKGLNEKLVTDIDRRGADLERKKGPILFLMHCFENERFPCNDPISSLPVTASRFHSSSSTPESAPKRSSFTYPWFLQARSLILTITPC